MKGRIVRYGMILLLLTVFACGQRGKTNRVKETPTAGSIKIAIDESLRPIIDAEVDGFTGLYKEAHIQSIYVSEVDAIDALLKDSVRLAIVTRKLTDKEKAYLRSQKNTLATEVKIAKDGIALILNPSNPDSLIEWKQLKGILSGEISKWKQITKTSAATGIDVVFDRPNSGIIRYLTDTIGLQKLPDYCHAVNSNEAVVDYVAKNKNSLGLIGLSWISDNDDSKANQFLKTIRVAGLAHDSLFYKPYQAYIAMKNYPLSREITVISREIGTGLGTGFISFAASDKGQRIVLKSGLVPVTMPVRIVNINRNKLQ